MNFKGINLIALHPIDSFYINRGQKYLHFISKFDKNIIKKFKFLEYQLIEEITIGNKKMEVLCSFDSFDLKSYVNKFNEKFCEIQIVNRIDLENLNNDKKCSFEVFDIKVEYKLKFFVSVQLFEYKHDISAFELILIGSPDSNSEIYESSIFDT